MRGSVVLLPTPRYVRTDGPAPEGLNIGSVVVTFACGERRLLLTDDTEHETDGVLTAWGERARVLKMPHHGLRTSSTAAFVAAVQLEAALISCGVGNKFKHPAPEVVARYRVAGVHAARTDASRALKVDVTTLIVEGVVDGYHANRRTTR